jgi:hypothetical protein
MAALPTARDSSDTAPELASEGEAGVVVTVSYRVGKFRPPGAGFRGPVS